MVEVDNPNEIPKTPGQIGFERIEHETHGWEIVRDDTFATERKKALGDSDSIRALEHKGQHAGTILLTFFRGQTNHMSVTLRPEGATVIILNGVQTTLGGIRVIHPDNITLRADRNISTREKQEINDTALPIANLIKDMTSQNQFISPTTLLTVSQR